MRRVVRLIKIPPRIPDRAGRCDSCYRRIRCGSEFTPIHDDRDRGSRKQRHDTELRDALGRDSHGDDRDRTPRGSTNSARRKRQQRHQQDGLVQHLSPTPRRASKPRDADRTEQQAFQQGTTRCHRRDQERDTDGQVHHRRGRSAAERTGVRPSRQDRRDAGRHPHGCQRHRQGDRPPAVTQPHNGTTASRSTISADPRRIPFTSESSHRRYCVHRLWIDRDGVAEALISPGLSVGLR